MWTRAEVKQAGKAALKRNYWKSLIVALIVTFVGGAGSGIVTNRIETTLNLDSQIDQLIGEDLADNDDGSFDILEHPEDLSEEELMEAIDQAFADEGVSAAEIAAIAIVVIVLLVIIMLIVFVLDIFLLNPIRVGTSRFFLVNQDEKAALSEVTYGFDTHYGLNIKTMFKKELFQFFWTLLFIIPGVIKAYEYRMIPYILADHNDITSKEAFAMSKEMMSGNKWNAFVLDLSFIGWYLLVGLSGGLLGLFFVNPYVQNTGAALYKTLKYDKTEEYYYDTETAF